MARHRIVGAGINWAKAKRELDNYLKNRQRLKDQKGRPRCKYCKKRLWWDIDQKDPLFCTVDHVKPRAKGGSDAVSNLAPCCKICNIRKGNMMLDEFKQTEYYLSLQYRRAEMGLHPTTTKMLQDFENLAEMALQYKWDDIYMKTQLKMDAGTINIINAKLTLREEETKKIQQLKSKEIKLGVIA